MQDPSKLSAYRDRRFPGTQEEYEQALLASTTLYIGNMSFYTTEEQVPICTGLFLPLLNFNICEPSSSICPDS
jgi:hypothetical protein